MERQFAAIIDTLRVATEISAALLIMVGVAYAVINLVIAHLERQTESFTLIRLTLSRYLSLGLEFQLAADILSTAIAPTWQEIGKLGATAAIRTGLNYFLGRDTREYREKQAEPELAAKPAVPRKA